MDRDEQHEDMANRCQELSKCTETVSDTLTNSSISSVPFPTHECGDENDNVDESATARNRSQSSSCSSDFNDTDYSSTATDARSNTSSPVLSTNSTTSKLLGLMNYVPANADLRYNVIVNANCIIQSCHDAITAMH